MKSSMKYSNRILGLVAGITVFVFFGSSVVTAVPLDSAVVEGQKKLPEVVVPQEIKDSGESVSQADEIVPTAFAVEGVSIGVGYDGTAVFDLDDQPGNDSGPSNGIVRTRDLVQYDFQYNSATGLTDPFIQSVLPVGMSWDSNDATCVGSGVSPLPTGVYDSVTQQPGGDRRLLVCQLPSTTQSVAGQIRPVARVDVQPHGTILNVSFDAGDASGTVVTSDEIPVTVSAAPFYDLRKIGRETSRPALGRDGVTPGILDRFAFGITIAHPTRSGLVDGAKGMAELEDTFSFTDDLSQMAPNAELYNWGNQGTGCTPIAHATSFPVPASAIGNAVTSTVSNSVVDSGTMSCSGGSGSFQVTLTGTDTRGTSFPTQYAGGNPIPPNFLYVATGFISVWYPSSDVIDAGGMLTQTNTFSGFDPNDVAGQSNYGAGSEALDQCFGRPGDPCNNSYTYIVNAGVGYNKAFRGYTDSGIPAGAGDLRSGDIRGGLGYLTRSHVRLSVRVVEQQNAELCDVFDRSSLRLVGGYENTPVASLYNPSQSGMQPQDYVIEYGAANSYPTTFAEAAVSTCNDADATWSTDPADPALGGALTPNGYRDSVDRVRLRFLVPLPPQLDYDLITNLEVYAPSTLDPARNPDGSIIANFGQIRYGASPSWVTNGFDPVTFSGGSLGDRIRLVPGEVRIAKTMLESAPGSGSQVLAGQLARFRLDPTANYLGSVSGNPLQDVVVEDILPNTAPRLTLDPVSITRPAGVGVEFCQACDGSDWSSSAPTPAYGVRWLFGDVEPSTSLPALELAALVPLEATNGLNYVNEAVISSPSDPSTVSQRTGRATATVTSISTVLTTKTPRESVRPLNSSLSWDLAVQNGTPSDVQTIDVIDLLPWNGDQRVPATNKSGAFTNISAANLPTGVEVYVSSADPASLDLLDGQRDGVLDPGRVGDSWYVAPGTGAWACTLAQVGTAGCPNMGEVTAIRFAAGAGSGFLIPSTQTVEWTLELTPSGNANGNVYTNQFKGRADEAVLQLPVTSPPAPIQIVAPSVALVKDVCTAAVCAADDDTVWAQNHTLPVGDDAFYRLTVTNTGPEEGDVVVTDQMPAGLSFVAGSAQASAGDVSGFPDTWNVGALLPGESANLVFAAQASVPEAITNVADAAITDRFDQTATAQDDAVLTAFGADVSVRKELVSESVDAEGRANLEYEITVANASSAPGTYTLRDQLKFGEGISITEVTVSNTQPGSLPVNELFDGQTNLEIVRDQTIGDSESHVYRVVVTATVPGGLTPEAAECRTGNAPGGFMNLALLDLSEGSRSDSACAAAPAGDIEIEKTGPAGAKPDSVITWTIRVTNTGTINAAAMTVTDRLPEGVQYESATGDPRVDGALLSWELSGLKAGEQREFTVTAKVTAKNGEQIENCASYTAPQGWTPVVAEAASSCASTDISADAKAEPGNGGSLATTGAALVTVLALGLLLLGSAAVLMRRRQNPVSHSTPEL